jgi:hypothetical protein
MLLIKLAAGERSGSVSGNPRGPFLKNSPKLT